MGNVKEGKYKVVQNYNSVEGALYENEVVQVYDNNTKPGHLRAKDSMGRVWFIPKNYLKKYDVFLDFIIFIYERINIAQVRILMLDYNS